ncbi:MAG: gfo/Idh/MocA family oxidoreductase [Caldilinea sp. CFX5]|nr:gfo/Idh/MocA family oxidoreductase [Caldilinea sp. CFX5]
MQPMRLGVIGLGLIWLRAHKPILINHPEAITPVALCDLAAERRATASADFPNAKILADYHELLQLPELDTVLVLTPIAFNAPIALAALEAGKHVIMEKPIARSIAEGQRLVETARRLGRRLFVLEQLGYRHAETLLAEQLAAGVIGDLVLWERVQHLEADTAQGAMRYDSTPWRKEANFPLGTLFDGGIHLIAAHSKLFGTPTKVAATGRKLREGYGDFDQVTMFFEYANGVTGLFSHSAYLPPAKNYFYLHGTTGAISVEPGRLVIEKAGQRAQVIELPAEHAYTNMWQALLAALIGGKEPYYTAERALQDVAILEAVAHSIKAGQRMSIMPVV